MDPLVGVGPCGWIDIQPIKATDSVTRRRATEECKQTAERSGLWCRTDMSVNEWCRFCHKYLKTQGVISHSTKIFEATGKAKTVFHRLFDLGLTLRKSPERSIRSCQKCTNLLSRIERDLTVFRKWQDEEKQADSNDGESASTAVDKGNRETSHSMTHRALKKVCLNPPNLTRIFMSEQRDTIEVNWR